LVERQNPVVTIKGAEEADPQFRIAAPLYHLRNTVGFFNSAIRLAAAIPYTDDITVQTIAGLSISHTHGLKPVWQESNFVPLTHVPSKINRFDRG
jgi:hypothetical protein